MNLEQAIREAAPLIGWKVIGDGRPDLFHDAGGYIKAPFELRSDCHAFVGLLEDWCRENSDTELIAITTGPSGCTIAIDNPKPPAYQIFHDDWLRAKLFALVSLARTLR